MENTYDNLDYCINILFNYAYNKEFSTDCYELHNIAISDIQPEDLKKSDDFNWQPILNTKLKYEYNYGSIAIFKKNISPSQPVMIKISQSNNSVMNDIKLSYIISEIALLDIYPFILLPIMNFDVDYNDLDKNITKNIEKCDKVTVQIHEHFFKLLRLSDFLDEYFDKMTDTDWAILYFQLLYILFKLDMKFGGFKHNSLDFGSVYVYIKKPIDGFKHYVINYKNFNLPNTFFELKICNFYNSKIGQKEDSTQYYDIHYFTQSLINYCKLHNKTLSGGIGKFVGEILPDKYKTNTIDLNKTIGLDESLYLHNEVNIITPILLLTKNNFLTQFIIEDNMMSSKNASTNSSENYIQSIEGNYSISTNNVSETSITDNNTSSRYYAVKKPMNNERVLKTSKYTPNIKNNFFVVEGGKESETETESEKVSESSASPKTPVKKQPTNPLLDKLPEGYSGELPQWMASSLPNPMNPNDMNPMGGLNAPSYDPSALSALGQYGQMGGPNMGGPGMGVPAIGGPVVNAPGMDQYPQMSAPQMGIPGMGQYPPMGVPGMGQYPQMAANPDITPGLPQNMLIGGKKKSKKGKKDFFF